MMSIKKQGKIIKFWFVIVILCLLGGCMFSPWYHIQVLIGNAEPRPFPIIRYWSEYSAKDFHDNVMAVPLVGVPGIVPIGYVGDLCLDTLFFPIDWVVSYFSADPTIEVEPCRSGRYAITVRTGTAQLHEDEALFKGCVPLTVNVQSGVLRIEMRTGAEETHMVLITPQRITSTRRGGGTWCKEISPAQPLTLMCRSPHYAIPAPLLPSLLAPYNAAPDVSLSISTDKGTLYGVGAWMSMYRQRTCVITITPSSDFVGECSYNGMPVSEVNFVYD